MSNMSFNSTWRKRLACERCRHLKVRCEYDSPTSECCMRCQRSNSKCVIPNGKRRDAQFERLGENEQRQRVPWVTDENDGNEARAVYLRNIIVDAEQKLADLNVSLFKQAIAAEICTIEEAQQYYDEIRSDPFLFPAIAELNMPTNITKLDGEWPFMTIAIICVKVMHTNKKQNKDIPFYVQSLYKSELLEPTQKHILDRQLAFCLICIYAQNFRDRALRALLHLHGLTIATIKQLEQNRQEKYIQYALDASAMAILPYIVCKEFFTMCHVAQYYHDMMKTNSKIVSARGIAVLLIEANIVYEKSMRNLENALTSEDLSKIIIYSIQTLEILEAETHVKFVNFSGNNVGKSLNSTNTKTFVITPMTTLLLNMKLKLTKKYALRFLELNSCCLTSHCTTLLHEILTRAADCSGLFFRAFADADNEKSFLPTVTFYHISDTLLCLQMMRFITFAGKVDVDIRSDCLFSVVKLKWEELVQGDIHARQLFFLLLPPMDMSEVKVGVMDGIEKDVYGSGISRQFEIIHLDSLTKQVRQTYPMTAEQLLDVMLMAMTDKSNESTFVNNGWYENVTNISLSLVLQFLANEV